MTEINNSLVLERLISNKHLFGPLYFGPLKWMAEHGGWFYRKEAEEANSRLHYLPSWYQDAGPRLEIAGLQIESRPALDGTGRKKYALTPLPDPVVAQTPEQERKDAIKRTLNGFGFGIYCTKGGEE